MEMYVWVILVVGAVIAFFLGWFASTRISQGKVANAERLAEKIVSEAEKEAQSIKRAKVLEAKEEWYRLKQNFENETKNKRVELQRLEQELSNREANMDKKADLLRNKERGLTEREKNLIDREQVVAIKQEKLDRLIDEQNSRLEKIAGMSSEEAKKFLMDNLLEKAKSEAAQMVKEIKDRARQTANREAKEIIIQAIQRTAADHSVETTVSVVNLPNDDMKGRIIGREGRNIRAFEMSTGVEVIVDDTPEAVILSGFDPLRREIAKVALEKLVMDGRIHPGRIEEVVEKTTKEMEEKIVEIGEQALMDTGVHGIHPELVKLLGKLKYRTSYGQNVLQHSVEVSYLSGLMAAQLQLDSVVAKRAGLLHDIGKAIDKYTEGTHTDIGLELVKKYGENPIVQNAVASHHEDVEMDSPISVLVQAADAISGSRPGARRETLEEYIKRLERLEKVAKSFDGVAKTYAIQAGREVRVIVECGKVDDASAEQLASEIAEKIQSEMEYPGQIRVTVIREYRAIDYAK